ncbi:phosphonate metabolism transcriptional regulator PhnF [Paracoccus liaowanqingii]|uniref:Phosphonate metabolism transcriptional regulator PhnF n=1 Tax=Paracoccus liaowanqingii TaxID=2560053 RepID=A0A4P7HM08_9RHOB|nr:phosphonate metabolism transcriptional regulator PhnF [Paracoccus liaowanqingii]QBX35279.1 phosphonate metabolism transcriptional regulator PhnF [Paracoccus liaowanqingii]
MTDAKPTLWQSIADSLRAEITGGHYPPGARLPSEAQLSARFGVNRHTVRHALSHLIEAGLVRPRRGAGVFVTGQPTDYALGPRVRFSQNLAAQGRTGAHRFTRLETRPCDATEAQALDLAPGDPVHVIEGISLADDQPLALFRSVLPGWLEGFPDHAARLRSITAALAACGVADYTRASTRLTAKLASPTQAATLRIARGAPILRSDALNRDLQGRPVEMGRTWFAGDRVTLVLAE